MGRTHAPYEWAARAAHRPPQHITSGYRFLSDPRRKPAPRASSLPAYLPTNIRQVSACSIASCGVSHIAVSRSHSQQPPKSRYIACHSNQDASAPTPTSGLLPAPLLAGWRDCAQHPTTRRVSAINRLPDRDVDVLPSLAGGVMRGSTAALIKPLTASKRTVRHCARRNMTPRCACHVSWHPLSLLTARCSRVWRVVSLLLRIPSGTSLAPRTMPTVGIEVTRRRCGGGCFLSMRRLTRGPVVLAPPGNTDSYVLCGCQ